MRSCKKKITVNLFLTLIIILPLKLNAQQNPRDIAIDWKTDKTKHNVPLDEFTILLAPDGIPPIDDPKFWTRERAEKEFFLHEPVIVVEDHEQAKAYPLSILTYHEIVNDSVGKKPVSVTYCPLCNAALVFDRRLGYGGRTWLLDFGVSGMLRNSDLVMWDRQTESWWQQFTGTALVGELAGAQLSIIPSLLISLEEFFEAYPQGMVLSTETGHQREYGTNPYTGYDDMQNKQPRLYRGEVDPRLPAMERVIDIHVDGRYKIYPLTDIAGKKVINDRFGKEPVVIFYTEKTVSVLDGENISDSRSVGSVTVFRPVVDGRELTFRKTKEGFRDRQSGSVWTIAGKCIRGPLKGKRLIPYAHGSHFAFAWLAFHPDSEIYGQ